MTAGAQRAPTLAAIWTGSTPTGRIRGSMAPRPNRPIWTWCQNWRRPHSMKSVVRPELSTAAAGPSQAPTAAVDNSAPRSTHPEPTYKSGKTVQLTGTTYQPQPPSRSTLVDLSQESRGGHHRLRLLRRSECHLSNP